MKANEYKQVQSGGLVSRLFGRKTETYALNIALGPESMEEVESELASVREALLNWARRRDQRKLVLVTVFASDEICTAIGTGLMTACRRDPEVAPLYEGVRVQLKCNLESEKEI